jgi:hypothetical protein
MQHTPGVIHRRAAVAMLACSSDNFSGPFIPALLRHHLHRSNRQAILSQPAHVSRRHLRQYRATKRKPIAAAREVMPVASNLRRREERASLLRSVRDLVESILRVRGHDVIVVLLQLQNVSTL